MHSIELENIAGVKLKVSAESYHNVTLIVTQLLEDTENKWTIIE